MLITRARSVRNAVKVPFKFKFELLIESVDKLAASGAVVLVWERSATKVLTTKAVTVDRNTRKVNFNTEVLSSDVTLFKHSPTDKKFQEKIVKLAIKANDSAGKTLGKIHLNLADHAEVPSGSKKIGAELSNGAGLVLTVQCVFLSMGKASKGGRKPDGGVDGANDDDDLDADRAESNTDAAQDAVPSNLVRGKTKIGRLGSKVGLGRGGAGGGAERRGRDSECLSVGGNGGDASTVEKLRKENARLRQQLEDAERSGGGKDSGKLCDENKALRKQVEELRTALAREPEFADVVSQLKETKMALALLQMEKDQLALQLMNNERSKKLGIPRST